MNGPNKEVYSTYTSIMTRIMSIMTRIMSYEADEKGLMRATRPIQRPSALQGLIKPCKTSKNIMRTACLQELQDLELKGHRLLNGLEDL